MPRTGELLVIHDIADDATRDLLGGLLLAAGKNVEVQWLDERRVVALIAPADLENPPAEEPNG
jgi:hypothetical protein